MLCHPKLWATCDKRKVNARRYRKQTLETLENVDNAMVLLHSCTAVEREAGLPVFARWVMKCKKWYTNAVALPTTLTGIVYLVGMTGRRIVASA